MKANDHGNGCLFRRTLAVPFATTYVTKSRPALVGLCLALMFGCQGREWQGWVYLDRNNRLEVVDIGSFTSLAKCRAAAHASIGWLKERSDKAGETVRGDYGCGYNCDARDERLGTTKLCEDTRR